MKEKNKKTESKEIFYSKKNIYTHPLYKSIPLLAKLDMELTERCNNNCIHCYINQPKDSILAEKKELSTKKIKEILDEASSLGCLDVRFTGGEPLLREDFKEIYIHARKLGLRASIFTNATLIDERLCSVFKKIPPLDAIEVTAYGMSQRTYEKVTQTIGSYEKFRNGLNLLLKYNIPFKIKIPYFSFTKNEINEFEDFASKLPWEDNVPGYTVFFDLRARRDSRKKNNIIEKLRNTPEESHKFLSRKKEEWLKEKKEFCLKFCEIPGEDLFTCGAGQGGGCVDAYGYFQLCMLLRHPQTVYDLKKGSLKDALTRFFPKVRTMKAKNPDYLSRCALCFLSALCEQCPARSWMEHGTLDTPVEYYCRAAHLEAQAMGLLKKGEKAWKIKDWKKRLRRIKS